MKLEGLDDEIQEQEKEKVVSIDQVRNVRKEFHIWKVGDAEYRMKLTTSMITQLENKYHVNVLSLISQDDLPPLSIMLTVTQAAMAPWNGNIKYGQVQSIYDRWIEQGGSQTEMLAKVIMPTLAVSGFFTPSEAEKIMKSLEEAEALS